MIRPRSAFVALALAAVGVAGCGGSKDATEGSVRNKVEERLLEVGYVASPDAEPIEVAAADAEAIAGCVARTMFESTDTFSKEERNAAARSSDGDEPDPDLVLKVEALVNSCYEQVVNGEDDEEADADGETTTTEG